MCRHDKGRCHGIGIAETDIRIGCRPAVKHLALGCCIGGNGHHFTGFMPSCSGAVFYRYQITRFVLRGGSAASRRRRGRCGCRCRLVLIFQIFPNCHSDHVLGYCRTDLIAGRMERPGIKGISGIRMPSGILRMPRIIDCASVRNRIFHKDRVIIIIEGYRMKTFRDR